MQCLSPTYRATAWAAFLACGLAACDSPTGRTPASSGSAGTPFEAGNTATDPAAAAQRLAANANVPDSLHLISPGRVGRLRLNQTEKGLLALVPVSQLTKTSYQYQGATYPAYEMRDAQEPSAPPTILEMDGSEKEGYRLRRIRIRDPQYRTAEGIGVGSPFGAARQTYGLTRVRFNEQDYVAISGTMRIGWILDEKSLPAKHSSDMSSADIPPATRITGVIVVR
ncbi:hypothetical protein [Hymenobacter jejuensis]|uniref:Uncharacterized protein n=1 Tax=Hymenobacter jejuensis TaxID=2502781 RepID=A0A5B8A437_9BACT|nr:hypothetical protein [Hymenobacter jejuensis]QDA62174.1 hypothetical protein FHG12_19635 [Hymenobacter jejuensis]